MLVLVEVKYVSGEPFCLGPYGKNLHELVNTSMDGMNNSIASHNFHQILIFDKVIVIHTIIADTPCGSESGPIFVKVIPYVLDSLLFRYNVDFDQRKHLLLSVPAVHIHLTQQRNVIFD